MTGLRRLLPDPGPVDVAEALAGLLPPRPSGDRPRVLVNMVTSADGRATVDGRSRGLSGPADREVFHGLRERVDAVLAGPGTIADEGYGRLVRDPARRAARERHGLAGDPLAVVVSRSGRLPLDAPLFAAPEQPVAVLVGRAPDPDAVAAAGAPVEVVEVPGCEPAPALRALAARLGVRTVLCEGGPRVLAAFLAAGVVDELFLTVAPLLAGGKEDRVVAEAPALPRPAGLTLRHVLEADGTLFLRYGVGGASAPG